MEALAARARKRWQLIKDRHHSRSAPDNLFTDSESSPWQLLISQFEELMKLSGASDEWQLSADADSIYPKAWIDSYVDVLKNKEYSCAYGRYSFIPSAGSSRFALALHEIVAESYFLFRRKRGKDYLNVMGFNFE